MNYDKNSFLAGLAVGRQLKGWATALRHRIDNFSADAVFSVLRSIAVIASQGSVQIATSPSISSWIRVGDEVQIDADVTISEQISGAYTITASMEVEE